MSMANMSLAEGTDNSIHTSGSTLNVTHTRRLSVQYSIVRNLTRRGSAKNLELRSRSLDYLRKRKKADTPLRET